MSRHNTQRIAKYPRTRHLPFSPGVHRDDRIMENVEGLLNVQLVFTEKLDGSGVCLTREELYARSRIGPPNHPSFAPLWGIFHEKRHLIPDNWSLFGEWCFAVHAVTYPDITDNNWLNLFGIRFEDTQNWASFNQVQNMAQQLGVPSVPVDDTRIVTTAEELEQTVERLRKKPSVYGPTREGIVVRSREGFPNNAFSEKVGKWVRAGHVAGEHWQKRIPRRHDDPARDFDRKPGEEHV